MKVGYVFKDLSHRLIDHDAVFKPHGTLILSPEAVIDV
jgi:hypothetical protein